MLNPPPPLPLARATLKFQSLTEPTPTAAVVRVRREKAEAVTAASCMNSSLDDSLIPTSKGQEGPKVGGETKKSYPQKNDQPQKRLDLHGPPAKLRKSTVALTRALLSQGEGAVGHNRTSVKISGIWCPRWLQQGATDTPNEWCPPVCHPHQGAAGALTPCPTCCPKSRVPFRVIRNSVITTYCQQVPAQ